MEQANDLLQSRDVNLKLLEKTNNLEDCHMIPVVQSQMSSLRISAIQSSIALCVFNTLDDENKKNSQMEDEDKKREKMNKSKKETESTKRKITEVEEIMKKYPAEAIQTLLKGVQEKILLLEKQLSNVEEEGEEYKKLLQRKQLLDEEKKIYFSNSRNGVSKDDFQTKVQQTDEATRQCIAAIETLKERRSLFVTDLHSLKQLSDKLEEIVYSLKKGEERSLKQSKEHERINYLLELLTCLSGFRVVKVMENCITIEIQDIQEHVPVDERPVFSLTLQFAEVDGLIVVEDVKTDALTFFIQDMIEQVKTTTELKTFLLEVQKRFHNEAKLLKEMKTLQDRFAIDWNGTSQTVRVMLGKCGQIVCTLKIHNGYPSAGHISVEEIHGADQSVLFEDMTSELRSLTSWIEYLSLKYGTL